VSVLWLLQIGVVQISAAGCLWDDCMENIHARRVDCALEVGLGAALAPMWNQRFAAIPARSADEFEDLRTLVARIEGKVAF
jgi:[acyl-carrier-protein] S-malonyltransferase